MPFKWKLYQITAIYIIVISIAFCIFTIYAVIDDHFDTTELKIGSIVFMIGFALSVKSVYSIKALAHYKNNTLLTRVEKVIFIIGFIIVAVATLSGLAEFTFVMVPTLYHDFIRPRSYYVSSRNNYGIDILSMLIITFLVVTLICGAITSIFDFPLLRAIRKRHYAMLDDIGKNIVEIN